MADKDGGNIIRLTENPGFDVQPSWSSNGNQIAFTSDRNGNQDIYLLDLDNRELTQLTDDPGNEFSPELSPDGSHIIYSGMIDENLDLYVMNTNGADKRRLTFNPEDEDNASWSPDGVYIVYDSNRNGNYDLFLMNVASGEETQLTSDPRDEYNPDWGQSDYEFGTDPWFGYPMCIRDVDDDYVPDETADFFYTTDSFKFIGFQYRNMEDGTAWGHKGISTSALKLNTTAFWHEGADGFYILLPSVMTSEPGPYTVELYIGDELVQEVFCEIVEP
jgi:dipeptidyl aminopeptidase/acylaminoacyl peptidase